VSVAGFISRAPSSAFTSSADNDEMLGLMGLDDHLRTLKEAEQRIESIKVSL